eukprot:TRINITY_DN868_c0_g1_i1.p1 TRINITY_DN868_c0_g1~~TRINITY_DN868_c0_g1_i1.p1  ORF type:complete len:547 (+),score=167.58 TRINITY_DN868_c0_g1_i1:316-1956(+)
MQAEAGARVKEAQFQKAQKLQESGIAYFHKGEYLLAKQLLSKAAELKDEDSEAAFLADTLLYISFADINEGNLLEGLKSLNAYLNIKMRLVPEDDDQIITVYYLLGAVHLMATFEPHQYLLKANGMVRNKTEAGEEVDATLWTVSEYVQDNNCTNITKTPYSTVLRHANYIISMVMPAIPLRKSQKLCELYTRYEYFRPNRKDKDKMKKTAFSENEIIELVNHLSKRAEFLESKSSNFSSSIVILEEATALMKEIYYEQHKEKAILLVCRLVDKLISSNKHARAKEVCVEWKAINAEAKKREAIDLALDPRLEMEVEKEREEEEKKWADYIALHKLDAQFPRAGQSLTAKADQTATSTQSKSTKKANQKAEKTTKSKKSETKNSAQSSDVMQITPLQESQPIPMKTAIYSKDPSIQQQQQQQQGPLPEEEAIDANEVLLDELYAKAMFMLGNHKEALKEWNSVLVRKIKLYRGRKHLDVVNTYKYLCQAHLKLGNVKEAKECQEMELRILEALFGAAHPRVKDAIMRYNLDTQQAVPLKQDVEQSK